MSRTRIVLIWHPCGHQTPVPGTEDSYAHTLCSACNAADLAALDLAALDAAIRNVRFSKRYALGLPGALAELDHLYAARERLERGQPEPEPEPGVAEVMTAVRLPSGEVDEHRRLCLQHLAQRVEQGSTPLKDGVNVHGAGYECDDCRTERLERGH